jgi:hypothetical protein
MTVGEQDDRLFMVKFLATLVGSVPGATEITPVPICDWTTPDRQVLYAC